MKFIPSPRSEALFSDCGRYLLRPAAYGAVRGIEAMCRAAPHAGSLGVFPSKTGAEIACENHQKIYFTQESPHAQP